MSEHISAQSLKHPERVTELELLHAEPLFAGGFESKQLINAALGDRMLTFVARDYDQRYVDNWLAFGKAGMPVVSTLRAYTSAGRGTTGTTEPDKLLLTDMKADGGELYGKGLLVCLKEEMQRERANRVIDSLFLDITASHMPEVEERAWDYTRTAFKNRLTLPLDDDAYELLVKPDGAWDLVTLDLSHARSAGRKAGPPEAIAMYNHDATSAFLRNLQRLRTHLAEAK